MQEGILSFGVRHLRSFGSESQMVPIKPINILVGKNSCGKSTFLRTFPLLRQSIQADTKSPILWFGGLVDFGDFDTALHDGADSITFDFNAVLKITNDSDFWFDEDYGQEIGRLYQALVSISISRVDSDSLKTNLVVKIANCTVVLVYSGDSIEKFSVSNSVLDVDELFPVEVISKMGALLPLGLRGLREHRVKSADGKSYKRLIATTPLPTEMNIRMTDFLTRFHHPNKEKSRISSALENLEFSTVEELYADLKGAFHRDKVFLKNLDIHRNYILEGVFSIQLAGNFERFLDAADRLLKKFYSGVKYQGPLRAAGERFYRYQDLRVDEVDHTGGNLPMVINSLDNNHQRRLSYWILQNFGFELELVASGLHYEIRVREQGDASFHNISDMGFGYSQILPVIVSIWLELLGGVQTNRLFSPKSRGPRIIVLEQPELHLHPALQFKFGLAMAKVIRQAAGKDIFFVIETHSKHLIDAIGESIRDDVIDESVVNIALFEKRLSGITHTQISGFDEDGYLINWPVGFLSPEYDN